MTDLLRFAIKHGDNFLNKNHADVLLLVKNEALAAILPNAKAIVQITTGPHRVYKILKHDLSALQHENRQLVTLLNGINKKLASA